MSCENSSSSCGDDSEGEETDSRKEDGEETVDSSRKEDADTSFGSAVSSLQTRTTMQTFTSSNVYKDGRGGLHRKLSKKRTSTTKNPKLEFIRKMCGGKQSVFDAMMKEFVAMQEKKDAAAQAIADGMIKSWHLFIYLL